MTGTCSHCGVKVDSSPSALGLYYCDTCNTDSCLQLDENGDTYCELLVEVANDGENIQT